MPQQISPELILALIVAIIGATWRLSAALGGIKGEMKLFRQEVHADIKEVKKDFDGHEVRITNLEDEVWPGK